MSKLGGDRILCPVFLSEITLSSFSCFLYSVRIILSRIVAHLIKKNLKKFVLITQNQAHSKKKFYIYLPKKVLSIHPEICLLLFFFIFRHTPIPLSWWIPCYRHLLFVDLFFLCFALFIFVIPSKYINSISIFKVIEHISILMKNYNQELFTYQENNSTKKDLLK